MKPNDNVVLPERQCYIVSAVLHEHPLKPKPIIAFRMQAIKSLSRPWADELHRRFLADTTKPFLFLFYHSFSSSTEVKTNTSSFTDFLINNFKISKTQALSISTRFHRVKSHEKPQSVILFLQNLGFSETHIWSAVRVSPQILFSDIDKTLKPKIEFFQDLGLVGSELSNFISKNSRVLTVSLERRLVPCVEILNKILCKNENNQDLFRVLRRCSALVRANPESRLVGNIAFLKSCGIVGSQLSMFLTSRPRLFNWQESKLRDLVSRVLDMGFSVNSRMLVYGLYTVSCMSNDTFMRKLELFRSFGFSSDECMEMFRKQPALLRSSEEKVKLGIEFFMNTIKLEKSVLVRFPVSLMYNLEERVIPRYMVLQILKSKSLLKSELSFVHTLNITDEKFLEKFIVKFSDHAEELLVAYKGHLLDSSSVDES
jgi:mTERF domain-containing protein